MALMGGVKYRHYQWLFWVLGHLAAYLSWIKLVLVIFKRQVMDRFAILRSWCLNSSNYLNTNQIKWGIDRIDVPSAHAPFDVSISDFREIHFCRVSSWQLCHQINKKRISWMLNTGKQMKLSLRFPRRWQWRCEVCASKQLNSRLMRKDNRTPNRRDFPPIKIRLVWLTFASVIVFLTLHRPRSSKNKNSLCCLVLLLKMSGCCYKKKDSTPKKTTFFDPCLEWFVWLPNLVRGVFLWSRVTKMSAMKNSSLSKKEGKMRIRAFPVSPERLPTNQVHCPLQMSNRYASRDNYHQWPSKTIQK